MVSIDGFLLIHLRQSQQSMKQWAMKDIPDIPIMMAIAAKIAP